MQKSINTRFGAHIVLVAFVSVFALFGCRDSQFSEQAISAQESENTFVFLGDMHFDRPGHHDMDWVARDFPNDIVQIKDYCLITQENTPSLMTAVAAMNARQLHPFSCIIQAGDFTEGLCGSYELQALQFREAISFVSSYAGDVPFLITKGNHDITGPGAAMAYDNVVLPWLSRQLNQSISSASYAVSFGSDRFIFFDAFKPDLDWLATTLSDSKARYHFLITHVPVVPFDARSTWHLFAADNENTERDRLLNLLGQHKVIVLCGHLHGFSILQRNTPSGSFLQIAMNSVISDKTLVPANCLSGAEKYSGELVNLEPAFSPESLELRKQILEDEKSMIQQFEYAKTAGFCLVQCGSRGIELALYPGIASTPWKSWLLEP